MTRSKKTSKIALTRGSELMAKKRAMVFYGGWPGHYPKIICDYSLEHFLKDFEVDVFDNLDILTSVRLLDYDVIIPIWTVEKLTVNQEAAIITAVEHGVGLATWHGTADAFNDNHLFKFMLGGQFICHPGDFVEYSVDISDKDHTITEGLGAFKVVSEQYFVHVDPNNHVLATTTFKGQRYPWLAGQSCPAAWTRMWGKGRVFYQSVGHTVNELAIPEVYEMTKRGIAWAADGRAEN